MCDASTRGIWADAVNYMLLQRSGSITGTHEQLARLLRCRVTQLQAAICELRQHGVATISEESDSTNGQHHVHTNSQQNLNTTIVCRRLAKELSITSLRSKAGLASSTKRQHTCQHTSASASASASVRTSEGTVTEGIKGGLGGFANRPSLKEVLSKASFIGLAPWKAEDWFNEMEGCGWLDYSHRPIADWCAVLTRVKTKWESDGRPSSPPKNRNTQPSRPRGPNI